MIVTTPTALNEMVAALQAADLVAFDTEGTSDRPEDAELVGVSFATPDGSAWYVPVGHYEGTQLLLADVLDAIAPILQRGVICHGGKYDIRLLAVYNTPVHLVSDTMAITRLTGEVDYGIGLKDTVKRWLGREATEFKDIVEKGQTAADAPIEAMADYAKADALNTLALYVEGLKRLPQVVQDMLLGVEVRTMELAAAMEEVGLPIERGWVEDQVAKGHAAADELRRQAVVALSAINPDVREDLNLRSAPQLQEALFDLCQFPVLATSKKTGKPSANSSVIDRLAKTHPQVRLIADYRSAASLTGRYEEMLTHARQGYNGWYFIHPSLNPTGTATGRWSSSGPNAQNLPRTPFRFEGADGTVLWEGKLRDAITAPPGFVIVSADYSQMELRVAAGASREATWLDAFATGTDVHRATAGAVFGKRPDEVTDDERYIGKTLNFSMLFGAQDGKVAELLGISKVEASRIIGSFWRGLPSVAAWVQRIHARAQRGGFVETMYGRRRYLPDLADGRDWVREKALRESVNTVIQGTAADMLKVGLVRQAETAEEWGAQLFLVVHDQFVWLLPENLRPEGFAAAVDPHICVQLPGLPEIVADYGVGYRLGSLNSFKPEQTIGGIGI